MREVGVEKKRSWGIAWIGMSIVIMAATLGAAAVSADSGKDVCQHYSWVGGPLDAGEVPPRAPGDGWQANTKQEPHSDSGNKPATWVTGPPGLHYTSDNNGRASWFDCVAIEPEPSESPSASVTPTEPTPTQFTPTATPTQPEPSETATTSTPSASGSPRIGSESPSPSDSPSGSATAEGTPSATPVASSTPTGRSTEPSTRRDGPRPKSSTPTTTKTPTATPAKPKLPSCDQVAKEQAGKTYAKDSPEANGIRCTP